MSLLTLENISKEYKNQRVLDKVSLRVEYGDRVALVGPNGAGKSTLIKIALGLEVADSGKVIKAKNIKIGYLSQDMLELREEENQTALGFNEVIKLEEKIKKLEENMKNLYERKCYEEYDIVFKKYTKAVSEFEAMDGYIIESKIMKILLGLGLKKEVVSSPIALLSGGEKMRVLLARILINEPDLIILDEPTNHLDVKTIEWLERFLKKFNGGVLMVSHDRYFLDEASTRIAELNNGTICERSCSYSDFVEQRSKMLDYYRWEQKGLELKIKREKEVIQELKSHRKITAFKSREKQLNKLIEEKTKAQEKLKTTNHIKIDNKPKIRFSEVQHVSKDIAWGKNLSKSFGDMTIIKNAYFNIYGGDRIGIVGDNGCGKTTLLNILLGKDLDFKGEAALGPWVRYGYLGQDIYFEDENKTLIEEIMNTDELEEKEARYELSKFQFYGEDVNKAIKVLSGGEKVRLYLIELLLKKPHCLIMDEPTNHLDLAAREAIEEALKLYKGTVIAVSHDRYFLKRSVNKILEMENGKITIFNGNYTSYRNEKFGKEEVKKEEKAKEKENYKGNCNKSGPRAIIKSEENLEKKIMALEEEMKLIEKSFNENTPYGEYKRYDELKKEVEALYQRLE